MERRLYSRVTINLPANFIKGGNDPGLREFSAKIYDICEEGIKIEIKNGEYDDILSTIKVGDILSFQAVDEYELYREEHLDVISAEAEVVRIEKGDEVTAFGCKVASSFREFSTYVMNKKISILYDNRS